MASERSPDQSLSSPLPPGTVQVWVGGRRHNPWLWWLSLVVLVLGLGGGLLLLVVSFRWGLQLMLDPEATPQVQGLWGRWHQEELPSGRSLTEIEQSLVAANHTLGEPVKLSPEGDREALLIWPEIEVASGAIATLHLLNRKSQAGGQDSFTVLTSVPVPAVSPTEVLTPLWSRSQTEAVVTGVFLPTQLTPLPLPASLQGSQDSGDRRWLTLEGHSPYQGITLRYGQLVVVDLQRQTLDLLDLWSSPANRLPYWADLDSQGIPGLLVDQTLGLEPSLQGWLLTAGQLQPISWFRVPLDAGPQAMAYHQGLRLARSGLWAAAAEKLATLKPSLATQWNTAATAQLDLINRHALLARQQAERSYSLPTQQILALLVDSRWDAALTHLEADPTLLPALMRRLERDQGQFWSRVSAATALSEVEPALYVWGGIALKAQQNQAAAQDWFNRYGVSGATKQRWTALIKTLDSPPVVLATDQRPSDLAIAPATPQPPLAGVQGMVGVARPLDGVTPDRWHLPPGQGAGSSLGAWYAIELQGVRQAQWQTAWLTTAKSADLSALWTALVSSGAIPLQLLHWASTTEGRAMDLSVRGVRVADGTIILLATGPQVSAMPLPALAFSQGSLGWLDASQSQPVSPESLHQGIEAAIAPRPLSPQALSTWSLEPGTVRQHRLDLTGNGQLEQVLTLMPAALDQLQNLGLPVDRTAHKTLILGPDQRLIYSNLFSPQTVVALTTPGSGSALGLLVHQAGGYRLLAWTETSQRFETPGNR